MLVAFYWTYSAGKLPAHFFYALGLSWHDVTIVKMLEVDLDQQASGSLCLPDTDSNRADGIVGSGFPLNGLPLTGDKGSNNHEVVLLLFHGPVTRPSLCTAATKIVFHEASEN